MLLHCHAQIKIAMMLNNYALIQISFPLNRIYSMHVILLELVRENSSKLPKTPAPGNNSLVQWFSLVSLLASVSVH